MIHIVPFLLGVLTQNSAITPVVHIEGIMGSGKSTLINYIESNLSSSKYNYIIIREPTSTWTHLKWITPEDNQQSQQFILYHMEKMLTEALQNKSIDLIITDRSSWSVCNVFMKMHPNNLSENLCNLKNGLKSYIIFCNVHPETAYSRLQKRNRQGDSQIPLSYLNFQNKLFHDANITTVASLVVEN